MERKIVGIGRTAIIYENGALIPDVFEEVDKKMIKKYSK